MQYCVTLEYVNNHAAIALGNSAPQAASSMRPIQLSKRSHRCSHKSEPCHEIRLRRLYWGWEGQEERGMCAKLFAATLVTHAYPFPGDNKGAAQSHASSQIAYEILSSVVAPELLPDKYWMDHACPLRDTTMTQVNRDEELVLMTIRVGAWPLAECSSGEQDSHMSNIDGSDAGTCCTGTCPTALPLSPCPNLVPVPARLRLHPLHAHGKTALWKAGTCMSQYVDLASVGLAVAGFIVEGFGGQV